MENALQVNSVMNPRKFSRLEYLIFSLLQFIPLAMSAVLPHGRNSMNASEDEVINL